MTYETVRAFSAMGGLALFIVLFAGAVWYALAPANKAKFDRAARLPLDEDKGEA